MKSICDDPMNTLSEIKKLPTYYFIFCIRQIELHYINNQHKFKSVYQCQYWVSNDTFCFPDWPQSGLSQKSTSKGKPLITIRQIAAEHKLKIKPCFIESIQTLNCRKGTP